jgi:hypothetical protein
MGRTAPETKTLMSATLRRARGAGQFVARIQAVDRLGRALPGMNGVSPA